MEHAFGIFCVGSRVGEMANGCGLVNLKKSNSMADRHSNKIRSKIMRSIKGKETKSEVMVRKFLFKEGFRYRKNVASLPGKPDIVLRRYSTVIMINGCFWHGHENCNSWNYPSTRAEYWKDKIDKNKLRDKKNSESLSRMGWTVITIWECQLKKNFTEQIQKIITKIIS